MATGQALEVLETGPLATVQDLGRPGLASLGVGQSGAADVESLRLANRLVGNDEGAAGVEATLGGLTLRARGGSYVALTGAPCPMTVDGRQAAPYSLVWLPDGAVLRVGAPTAGLRSYLAVRGGLDLPLVIESRSTDTLAGLGPAPLSPGDRLPVGDPPGAHPAVDLAPVRRPGTGEVRLRVLPGPRADWFTRAAHHALVSDTYEVTAESNRIGMRLLGAPLSRTRDDELPSEGMVRGALQVPPSGQPTLFLADHPVTGGYPVIAVVVAADIGLAAQARPGQHLRFTRVPPPGGLPDDG
jgi:biotin-dependent carboxylase-like uncharacterized protein